MTTFLNKVRNYVFPTSLPGIGQATGETKSIKKDLRNYISPVQLSRIRHDVNLWREAVQEAELAWYPHRVRMQRMFVDTILNGHVQSCIQRRKDLTLLRDYCFKNDAGVENEDTKKIFKKRWFAEFLEYAFEAILFGYTLIEFGDLINDDFPDIGIVKRWNISPDRLNVTGLVYSVSGVNFMDPASEYTDWCAWVRTKSDTGQSKVGYGLLYSVAVYEILARNLLGQNADAAELYGTPLRKGITNKTDEAERSEFAAALQQMGSTGWILLDAMDQLELVESKGMGQAYKIFPDLESRLEKKITKLILGHSDAMDSVPGKLGSGQGDGGSPQERAMADKQAKDGAFLEDVVNGTLIPKLIKLGFNIDPDYKFCFENNSELQEARQQEDEANDKTADVILKLCQAGIKVDAKYVADRTGIPCSEIPVTVAAPVAFDKKVTEALNKTYKIR